MARYVAAHSTTGLYPGGQQQAFRKAQIDAWVDTAISLYQTVAELAYPILGLAQYDRQAYVSAKDRLYQQLQAYNHHLQANTFLVGDHITLADIVVAAESVLLYCLVSIPVMTAPQARCIIALPHANAMPGCVVLKYFGTFVNGRPFTTSGGGKVC